MADTSGQAEIRGIDITKVARGFADEEFIFKRLLCRISKTKARELRWFQRTAGVTNATAPQRVENVAPLALPTVLEQSWTRNTSYVRKYFVESPWISEEDIKDSDVDLLIGNVQHLIRQVSKQVDTRIYGIISDTAVVLNTASTAAWNAASGQDPIKDLMVGKRKIRANGYNPEGAYLLLSALDHQSLIVWLISTKGSSIPSFASSRVQDGTVMEILGLRVIVSENVTADSATIAIPKVACTWKEFMPISAAIKIEEGIGRKIRIWEEGEAILTDPNAVHVTTNTQT